MRRTALLTALFLAAGLASPAFATDYATPEALIASLYDNSSNAAYDAMTQEQRDAYLLQFPMQDDLSEHLLGLFQAERDANPDEPSNLDWDPLTSGQDGTADDVKIGTPEITGDRATVVVDFVNFEPVELIFSLVNENGGWKIDDIANEKADFPWSVAKQISTP